MGYYITVRDINIKIAKENFDKALKAIQDLGVCSWYRSAKEPYEIDNLPELLKAWRYDTKEEFDYLVFTEFYGEKFGSDEKLFETLAPYVEPGSSIHFIGEDYFQWKYKFDGNIMKEVHAHLEWDE